MRAKGLGHNLMNGYIMAAGHQFAIVGIVLEKGGFTITAVANGPLPKTENASPTLFGRDGRGVCQFPATLNWPEIGSDGNLTICQHFNLKEVLPEK